MIFECFHVKKLARFYKMNIIYNDGFSEFSPFMAHAGT